MKNVSDSGKSDNAYMTLKPKAYKKETDSQKRKHKLTPREYYEKKKREEAAREQAKVKREMDMVVSQHGNHSLIKQMLDAI
jgi:hypothetical protein